MKDFLEISQCGNNYYNLPNRKEFPNQEFLTASRKNFQIQNHFFCSEILSIRGKYIQIRRKYITLPLKSFKFYIIEFFFKQRQKTVNNLFFTWTLKDLFFPEIFLGKTSTRWCGWMTRYYRCRWLAWQCYCGCEWMTKRNFKINIWTLMWIRTCILVKLCLCIGIK